MRLRDPLAVHHLQFYALKFSAQLVLYFFHRKALFAPSMDFFFQGEIFFPATCPNATHYDLPLPEMAFRKVFACRACVFEALSRPFMTLRILRLFFGATISLSLINFRSLRVHLPRHTVRSYPVATVNCTPMTICTISLRKLGGKIIAFVQITKMHFVAFHAAIFPYP